VRLAPAHGLGEVEGSVLAPARQPVEATPDKQVEAGREMVAAEKLAAVDLALPEILKLGDLLDEAVAGDDGVRLAQLSDRRNRHGPAWHLVRPTSWDRVTAFRLK
jgi:hypothetical protein